MASLLPFLAAAASGLLMHLALPPRNLSALIWVAFIPLLWGVAQVRSPRAAFYVGLIAGLVLASTSLWWFQKLFGPAAVCIWALFALWPAIFAAWLNSARPAFAPGPVLLIAAVWTGLEYFRCEIWWFEFAWLTPGSVFHSSPGVLQWASLIGVYGISFLVVAVNGCLYGALTGAMPVWIPLLLIVGIYGGGYALRPHVAEGAIRVASIQHEEFGTGRIEALVREAAVGNPDFIVTPEGAFAPPDLDTRAMAAVYRGAESSPAHLVAGAIVASSPIERGRPEDCALVFAPGGKLLGRHTKVHLIPLMEKSLTFSFARRAEREVFATPHGVAGIQICFDENFSDLSRELTAMGAEFFLVPSYDPAAWGDMERLEHAALLPLRAVESRRWIARAASSGPSQVIDPSGAVRAELPLDAEGILRAVIAAVPERSLYHKVGWVLPWLCLAASVIAIAAELVGRRMGS